MLYFPTRILAAAVVLVVVEIHLGPIVMAPSRRSGKVYQLGIRHYVLNPFIRSSIVLQFLISSSPLNSRVREATASTPSTPCCLDSGSNTRLSDRTTSNPSTCSFPQLPPMPTHLTYSGCHSHQYTTSPPPQINASYSPDTPIPNNRPPP
jgi:hypothetical protein